MAFLVNFWQVQRSLRKNNFARRHVFFQGRIDNDPTRVTRAVPCSLKEFSQQRRQPSASVCHRPIPHRAIGKAESMQCSSSMLSTARCRYCLQKRLRSATMHRVRKILYFQKLHIRQFKRIKTLMTLAQGYHQELTRI